MSDVNRVLVVLANSRLRALLHFSLECSFPFDVVSISSLEEASELLAQDSSFSLIISDFDLGADGNQDIFNTISKSNGKFILLGNINPEEFVNSAGESAAGVFPHLDMLLPLNDYLQEYFSQEMDEGADEYTGITLPVLSFFSELPGDIYIQLKSGRYLKIFLAGDQVNDSDTERFRDRGVKELFIDRQVARWILAKSYLEMDSIINEQDILIDHQELHAIKLEAALSSLEEEGVKLAEESAKKSAEKTKPVIQKGINASGSTFVTGDVVENEASEFVTGDGREVEESEFVTGDGREVEESTFVTGDGQEIEESEFVTGDGQEIYESSLLTGKIGQQQASSEVKPNENNQPEGPDEGVAAKSPFVDIDHLKSVVETHLTSIPGLEDLPTAIAVVTAKEKGVDRRTKLLKHLHKKRPLGKVLRLIKVRRTDEDFFRDRTKLVQTISCSLAHVLEWDSDASLEKLIYIAHHHDLLIVNNPRLARIQTAEEMEKLRDKFTEAEYELFMNHPKIMNEIIQVDLTAPPDVGNIILQHHELPNRGGFPQKLNSPRVVPFAVLLSISINFAQYIIDNPKWNYDDYLRQATKIYNAGGSFAKVIRALKKIENTFR